VGQNGPVPQHWTSAAWKECALCICATIQAYVLWIFDTQCLYQSLFPQLGSLVGQNGPVPQHWTSAAWRECALCICATILAHVLWIFNTQCLYQSLFSQLGSLVGQNGPVPQHWTSVAWRGCATIQDPAPWILQVAQIYQTLYFILILSRTALMIKSEKSVISSKNAGFRTCFQFLIFYPSLKGENIVRLQYT
jgi:hypothetical protein